MLLAQRPTTWPKNMGLLVGIKACKQYGFTPLHVVGDSAMIITQPPETAARTTFTAAVLALPTIACRPPGADMAAPLEGAQQDG
ncbi:uncharacterized protein PITG_19937 [Phytophthora infestans T30-4]|uniref:RNase H type-1 domain-containing protein n=1 Tax=Phytophthora infestans (strain T30-4) TaxID=403677 RepID=D0P1U1_PHYIT|nr:uncharacterized protein PITG_19937 [Phytophthora infestans T30-4]EEY55074.1 hypothetical protein PITG_19937 [Phytophthora infestans T30-4]|eukprot:XP_002895733.1 hypothetical protein PITG_19937 [Phytophthora infestans T30-4]